MEKTAFISPAGKFQITKMPFGLKNAPATFQRMMDVVLQGLESFSVPYIDDILIFSNCWEDHLEHIRAVIERLQAAGLTAKCSKCLWGKSSLEYLGHVVGEGKVSVPQAKVAALRHYLRPVTKPQLKSFLGLAGYYRRFVHHFAEYARPLNEATKSQAPHQVEWTRVRLDSFDMLCSSLCNSCSLVIPNQTDVFTVQTDASYVGVGACLSVCRDGGELSVAFYSRQLKDAETLYAVTELECLAVVEAIRHFEVYLDGRTFTVQTDHRALEHLLTAKLVNRRLSRWATSARVLLNH